MFAFFEADRNLCCVREEDLKTAAKALRRAGFGFLRMDAPEKAAALTYLFFRDPGSGRASFLVNDPALLFQDEESAAWLSKTELVKTVNRADLTSVPQCILDCASAGTLRAVNVLHPQFPAIFRELPDDEQNTSLRRAKEAAEKRGPSFLPAGKKRVNLIAIGDVGSNILTGLHLLGGDVISEIGICDLSENTVARWEFEENQISYPWDYDRLPEVHAVKAENLFDCDVVIFAASKGIPPVGSKVKDTRMAQFESNRKIVASYARQARCVGFRGMFCQISDPVDPLARVMYLESNREESGAFDWKGLRAEQIQGFGLGVMNARAAYYAKRDPRFARFLTEGRTFGPHGQELVVADSISNYDDAVSRELTQRVVTANLEMRSLGFKPFVAPAYSSGALSVLLALRGEWHCGSVCLGKSYIGVKNRYTPYGLETEILPLPDVLFERIRDAERSLQEIV